MERGTKAVIRPREGACEAIRAKCPDPSTCYSILKKKSELARRVRKGAGVDISELVREARETYGRLQKVDLGEPQPAYAIIEKALIRTVPGLLTCIYGQYFCNNGYLTNVVMSLAGAGGYGKSTLAIYLSTIFRGSVLTHESEILLSLNQILAEGEWIPIFVLDDISGIITKYWIFERGERGWRKFFSSLEYAKDYTAITMFTSRTFEGKAKKFRELSNYRGVVKRLVIDRYMIDYIEWEVIEEEKTQKTLYIDILYPGLKLPDEYWEQILKERRKRTQILIIENIMELAKNKVITVPEDVLEKLQKKVDSLKKKDWSL